jgi:hypothetical protein
MGRPLNKKFFGNTNTDGSGVGGQGVAAVNAIANGLLGMAVGGPFAILAADITAPQLPGGQKPVLVFNATSSTAGTVAVVEAGSGYTSAPTVVVRGSLAGGSQTVSLSGAFDNVTLTSNRKKAASMSAFFGSSAGTVDIIRQVSSRRYQVRNGTTTGVVQLKASAASAAGQATIVATDEIGATYFVTKLASKKATLTQKTAVAMSPGGSTWVFITGASVPWSFDSATTGRVQITNI